MLDRLIIEFDKIVKHLMVAPVSKREHPDCAIEDSEFTNDEQKKIIALMRINHCGEVCAQGLYLGQALTTRNKLQQEEFNQAADEEEEHLAWTKQRVEELGGKTSYLNPLFYVGSLTIGVVAGICGDKWSLGFLEETEQQVAKHLTEHLDKLPIHDNKSRAIVSQMRSDELTHAAMAKANGAAQLPVLVTILMQIMAKTMTKTVYYI